MDAATPHPTEQTLQSYSSGKLDDARAEAVNQHLEHCAECRRQIAGMSADSFLGRVRDAQGPAMSRFGQSLLDGARNHKATKPAPCADTLPPGLAEHADYEVLKELGRGGMGVVYLAHNKLLGRDEVLKVMSRQLMERPGALERFLREMRAVAKLRHPNIVAAYSAFRLAEDLVFAMEHVPGLDLSKVVKAKGALPVPHACKFIHDAARGLQDAHENELIHRDIKPHNLMLSRERNRPLVKILDFGLAKASREENVDTALTSAGQALGTPDFIAPEQILDAQSADIRADIYSLGGTLFFLLTGRPPFTAGSLYDLYQAHISRDLDPLNLIRPEVPSELAALVGKMMAKEPKRRFQTPSEVAEALRHFFNPGGAAALRPAPGVPTFDPPRAGFASLQAPSENDSRQRNPRPSTADAPWESLIDTREPNAPVTPATASSTRRPRQRSRVAIATALIGIAVLLAGVTVVVALRKTRVRFEGLPDGAVVTVDDDECRLTHDGKTAYVKVAPGERAILVTFNGVTVAAQKLTLAWGEDRTFPVSLESPGIVSRPRPASTTPPVESRSASEHKAGPVVAGPANEKWVQLYNGKDLTGWKSDRNQSGRWQVENGVLAGSGAGAGISHLYSDRDDFKDFHLRVVARYRAGGSGAVVVRSGFGPALPPADPKYPKGFEATINSTHGLPGNTGGVFLSESGVFKGTAEDEFITNRGGASVRPDEWFTMDILADDDSLAVLVNGRFSAFYRAQARSPAQGRIALQRQTPNGIVEFRSVAIREIDRTKVEPNELKRFSGHLGRVMCVAFSPDSQQVLTGGRDTVTWRLPGSEFNTRGGDNTVRLWDVATGQNTRTYPEHDPQVRSVTFSADGRFGASCWGWERYEQQHVEVYDFQSGRKTALMKRYGPEKRTGFRSVILSDDGNRVRAALPDGTFAVWEVDDARELPAKPLKAGETRVDEFSGLLFSFDRKHLITGGRDGAVELWNIDSGRRIKVFSGHSGAVPLLAQSADGRLIFSGGVDDSARLWDVAAEKQLLHIDCKADGLGCVAISSDGKHALTGGRYGTIRVWDLATGRETGRLEGHTMGVNALAFSADGRLALSGSDDRTARVWRLPIPGASSP